MNQPALQLRLADHRTIRTTAYAVIALGIALRVLAYADNRSLWLDELMLSLNVATRSVVGLARPLDYGQTAPLLFLWVQRLAVRGFGVNEWALRAMPLIFGIALLPLLWYAGRRLLGEREALVAVLLAALAQPLIYYSSEAKQYASDAFATAMLLCLVANVFEAPERVRSWQWLALGGVIAAALSQPSVLVLVAIVVALALSPSVRRIPRWRARVSAMAVTWGVAGAVLYLLVYRSAANDAYMRRVWEAVFLRPTAPDIGERLSLSARDVLVQTMWPDWPGATRLAFALAAAAAVIGSAALWLRPKGPDGRAVAALCTLPIVGVFAASALGWYPIAVRLVLFLTPALFHVYGAAATALVDTPFTAHSPARDYSWHRPIAYAAVLVALALWRLGSVRREAIDPQRYEDAREIIARYARREGAAPVYVFAGGVPSWAFYTTDWRRPDTARLRWFATVSGPAGRAFGNIPTRGRAVGREDDSLRLTTGGREEVLGTGSGMEWRERVQGARAEPDEGWAANEARRLRESVGRAGTADSGHAWVYFAHDGEVQRNAVLAALREAGAHIVMVDDANAVALYRIRFTSVTASDTDRADPRRFSTSNQE